MQSLLNLHLQFECFSYLHSTTSKENFFLYQMDCFINITKKYQCDNRVISWSTWDNNKQWITRTVDYVPQFYKTVMNINTWSRGKNVKKWERSFHSRWTIQAGKHISRFFLFSFFPLFIKSSQNVSINEWSRRIHTKKISKFKNNSRIRITMTNIYSIYKAQY